MSLSKLKTLSLFSGVGGIDKGLEDSGFFETVAFCEIDKDCHKVLNKHWPEVPIFEDVKLLGLDTLALSGITEIDAIVGGFPCQDVSIAGRQKGLIDENGKRTRSGLWFEYKRLIEEIRPKYVIIENVRNLLSNGFATVLQDINEIGYDAEWYIISARDVGAPHLRERVWVIAYPNGSRLEGSGPQQLSTGIKGCFSEEVSREVLLTDTDCEGFKGRVRKCGKCGEMGGEQNGRDSDFCVCIKPQESHIPNADDIRLWRPFTTEEEKRLWGAETTACVRDRWQTESEFCRVPNGIFGELHLSDEGDNQLERYRMQMILEMLASGRLIVDAGSGEIFSTVIRGSEGQKIKLEGSDLNGYVVHGFRIDGKKLPIGAHQVIWVSQNGEFDSSVHCIDHINRDKKDNRIANLRLATFSENSNNRDFSKVAMKEDKVLEILYLRDAGLSLREIAEITGYSKSRIHQVVSSSNERVRKQRIKQLGNAVVPQILTIIGNAIYEYEARKCL